MNDDLSAAGDHRPRWPWEKLLSPLLLIIILSLLACTASDPAADPQHLLLITMDALRADHLGLYGYGRPTSPVLDELGSRSVVFNHAWVQWPKTTPSMTSMFSSTYPHVNGVVILASNQRVPDRLVMLPEVLRDQGFLTAGVVGNGVLGKESNFPQGFSVYRELWRDKTIANRTRAERVTDVALAELERLATSGRRFFLWVHYLEPHWPYEPPPGYAEPFLEDSLFRSQRVSVNDENNSHGGISSKVWKHDANDDVGWYVAHYDGEIRYVDEHVGRLVRGLDEVGVGDRTLVVVTSDHGESLGDHQYYFSHGHLPYEGDIRVPLMFHWPGNRYGGRRVAKPVELMELAPTVLEALGFRGESNPFERQGLLEAIRHGDHATLSEMVFSESGGMATQSGARYTLTVRKGSLKLVWPRSEWARELHQGRVVELYDLTSDPAELDNLAAARPEEAGSLRAALGEWFEKNVPVEVDRKEIQYRRETAENLRALGYL